ncbi:MAG TPA: zf-TFIIB domain-containing protein [Acidobacteriota bacterium]
MDDEVRKKQEDEWFKRHERILLEEARAKRLQKQQELEAREQLQERERLKALHWMRCPKCGHQLAEVEHHGIKIDRCGGCQGVFFDAGELDQLLLQQSEVRRSFFRKLTGLFD